MGENNLLEELKRPDERVAALEERAGISAKRPGVLELDLTLPGAEIGGLRFNKTEVHAVFEKGEDGWYQSRDILFLSARNTEADNSRDILTEYLRSKPVQNAFLVALYKEDKNIEISLPKESVGVKRYNGGDCWYWLAARYTGSAAHFCYVNPNGNASSLSAGAVGGCAPLFRVA